MAVWIICGILLLAFTVGVIWSELSAGRRIRESALKRFGKIPDGEYGLEDISRYAEVCKKEQRENSALVDEITWKDLDMDLVFRRINNCQSTVGEQYLYDMLHRLTLPADGGELEALCTHLSQNQEERSRLLVLLAKLGKKAGGGLSDFLEETPEHPLPLAPLYPVFAFLPFLSLLVCPIFPAAGFCAAFVFVCFNFYLYYSGKRKIQGDLDRLQSLFSLLWLCGKLTSLLTYSPLRNRIAACLPPFRPLRRRYFGQMQKGYSDLELLQEYFHILTLRDLRIYRKAMQIIAGHRSELRTLFECAGLLDAALCTLSFRKSLPYWSSPDYRADSGIAFSKLFHPLLRRPVPNSGSFAADVLLTGSNASGKSTFLKALGVNAILAQSLHTCTAEQFSLRPGPVLSSMAVQDDIVGGESYFMAEIRSLKRLTDAARTEPCLLLIDEILKGTNTTERLAASQAVLEELRRRDCLCIAATHDEELSGRLEGSFENFHFRETLSPEGITFDYKLHPGPASSRNAIALLSRMGFGSGITERAQELAGKSEKGTPQQ